MIYSQAKPIAIKTFYMRTLYLLYLKRKLPPINFSCSCFPFARLRVKRLIVSPVIFFYYLPYILHCILFGLPLYIAPPRTGTVFVSRNVYGFDAPHLTTKTFIVRLLRSFFLRSSGFLISAREPSARIVSIYKFLKYGASFANPSPELCMIAKDCQDINDFCDILRDNPALLLEEVLRPQTYSFDASFDIEHLQDFMILYPKHIKLCDEFQLSSSSISFIRRLYSNDFVFWSQLCSMNLVGNSDSIFVGLFHSSTKSPSAHFLSSLSTADLAYTNASF